jgi:hypothetical protein
LKEKGWTTPTPSGTFLGIKCQDNIIVSIDICARALNGALPSAIGNLSSLEELCENYNSLFFPFFFPFIHL